jgi:multidrug efflux pump subunit AcrB
MEEALQPLEAQGLNSVRSSTYPGRSIVSLSFAVGTNLDESVTRVETQLKNLKLPDNSTYKITPVNLNESAVVSYAIENPKQTLTQLTTLAQERILPTIAQVPGVLKVNLLGVPAGATVTAPTAKPNVAEQAVLNAGSSAVRFGGRDALALEVVKRGDANTLDVVKAVDNAIAQLRSQLPGVQVNLAATQAEYIREATDSTVEALGLAIVLSVIVIFPFLWDWKATLISALAIPTSLFGTFIVMALFGFNLETITLLALALVVGIIVDDAIVDVENIARHLDEGGKSPRQAAIEATDEIGLTVAAATLTIAAVFLPVAFMRGVVGQFFQPFGVTVSAAVLISLLVARTLSPLLAVYWLRPRPQKPSEQSWSGFVNAYRKLLQWSLAHRAIVVGIALLSFVAGLALIPIIPKGFIPKLDRGEFNITYTAPLPAIALNQAALAQAAQAQAAGAKPTTLPPGIDPAILAAQKAPPINPLQDSLDVAKKLEAVVLQSPEVESVFTTVGTRQQPNKGTLYVKLRKGHTVSTTALQDQFRQQLPVLENVTTSIEDIQFVDTGGEKPLQVGLIGDDPLVLSQTAKTIKERLEKLPGFADVTTTGAANTADRIVEIERRNDRRVAYVSANLGQDIALGDATDRAVTIANEVKPASVSLNLGGDSARLGEIFGSFGFTLGLAVICVLVVLLVLFRSWTDPLAIIFSLPLSIVGALLAALFHSQRFWDDFHHRHHLSTGLGEQKRHPPGGLYQPASS